MTSSQSKSLIAHHIGDNFCSASVEWFIFRSRRCFSVSPKKSSDVVVVVFFRDSCADVLLGDKWPRRFDPWVFVRSSSASFVFRCWKLCWKKNRRRVQEGEGEELKESQQQPISESAVRLKQRQNVQKVLIENCNFDRWDWYFQLNYIGLIKVLI